MDDEGGAEPPGGPKYPSLDLVRAELDTQVEDQARKSAMFDTRAGFVIAFGGLLIEKTKLEVLDTRIWLLQQDEERFTDKVTAMTYSVITLFIAVCLVLAGSIVDYATDKEAGDGTQDSRVTNHSSQVPPRSTAHG